MSRCSPINRPAIAIALALVWIASSTLADEFEEWREQSRLAWNQFLDENCSTQMSEQAVRKLMDKKHRDIGFARANEHSYRLLFLIDDYHQVEFFFNNDSTLSLIPFAERKGQWIRNPDGTTVSIPEQSEAAARAEAEDAAIRSIAREHGYKPEALEAFGKRGKKHKWFVVVIHNLLEVDPPTFMLEVSAYGEVKKWKP